MTQEEKKLLLKDLCVRLPYGLKVNFKNTIHIINALFDDGSFWLDDKDDGLIEEIRPYLRPISSMTEEEKKIMRSYGFVPIPYDTGYTGFANTDYIDEVSFRFMEEFLNAHHLDYRGLISMGLALEAPEGMYKTK